ncbi:centriolin-like [Macrobrachium nipponense]|uniref:centriolin-like n=1 Tax=Macrobrachium nipponense TaxID=159736 RepID=UPI0030C861E8
MYGQKARLAEALGIINEVTDTEEEETGVEEQEEPSAVINCISCAKVGDTVMVPVPLVDRGRAEFPNVKAVVFQALDNGTYKLGTKHGLLKQVYTRNQFIPCLEKFLSLDDVVQEREISLRKVAIAESMGQVADYLSANDIKLEVTNLMDMNLEKDEEIEKLKKEVIEIGKQIEGLEKEVIELMKGNERRKAKMEKEITNLKEELIYLQDMNLEKDEEIEKCKREAIEIGKRIEGLEDEVIELMEENQRRKNKMENEITDLKEELIKMQDMNLEKDEEIEKCKKEAIEVGETIEVLENEVIELMDENQRRKTKMENEINYLKEESMNLQSLNMVKDKEIEKCKKEVIEIGKKIEGLENEVIELMEGNQWMEKEMTDLKEEFIYLRDLNVEKEEEIEKLKKEEIEFVATIEGLKNEIIESMEEKQKGKTDMKAVMNNLKELIKEHDMNMENDIK